jgi:predicted PurR-regulated permease PerM
MAKARTASAIFILLAMITAVAALYFAKSILLPVALAILLCFLLTPLADRLERWYVPRVLAVLLVVGMCFAVMVGLGYVVTGQLVDLTQQLTSHRENLVEKVRWFRPSKAIAKVNETIEGVRNELADADKKTPDGKNGKKGVAPKRTEPQLAQPESAAPAASDRLAQPFEISYDALLSHMQSWIGSLVAPVTTLGLVIILVLFILLDRESQRTRLVQLFGRSHLHTTTEAIHDVARRVGRYLRMLFVVNATYGVAITCGLAIIGVPGAIMWGVLAFSLRFLPYIGPWIAATMPILVSMALSPGWTQSILVVGWFLIVELISNNVIEPLLYGSTIGISKVGVIVSAIFWTWLWGPIGLILAMPMTVCIMVGSRYVPQLRFIHVLLADETPASLHERVYQRLLSFDYHEPLKLAQKHLKETSLTQYYDDILVPALRLAEQDRHEDLLSEERSTFVLEATRDLIQELGDEAYAAIAAKASHTDNDSVPLNAADHSEALPAARVLSVPLRDEADEISSQMLAQLLVAEGFDVATGGIKSLTNEVVEQVADSECDLVIISILPPIGPRDSRLLWKRLRSRYPSLPIIVGYWAELRYKDDLPIPSHQFCKC